jgi:alkylated DNA repair dioxygenase AlkB
MSTVKKEEILLGNSSITHIPNWLEASEQKRLLDLFIRSMPWRKDNIFLYGRQVQLPRLQAWFSTEGRTYTYSRLTLPANPFSAELEDLREKIMSESGASFNAVLANLYRDGQDSMGWHSDNEPELGVKPIIASLSLGCYRKFQIRPKMNKKLKDELVELDLGLGSLLIMGSGCQENWEHQLPKQRRVTLPRLNLTFRYLPGLSKSA